MLKSDHNQPPEVTDVPINAIKEGTTSEPVLPIDLQSPIEEPNIDAGVVSRSDLKLYRLRNDPYSTDPIVNIPTPSPRSSTTSTGLTPEQIKHTLDYFVLCSERVEQMTRTYNDIEAVQQLLEEKEKDLELAAHIGQSLLEQNKELQQRSEFLEVELATSTENVIQLKHELQRKVHLLHLFSETEESDGGATSSRSATAGEDDEDDPVAVTSVVEPSPRTPRGRTAEVVNRLQGRVTAMEEENLNLQIESAHLKTITQSLEEKEQQLVSDCVRQLETAHKRIDHLQDELTMRNEECEAQQHHVSKLLKEMVTRQTSERTVVMENEELSLQIQQAQEVQAELTQEIMELQERYAEVVAMLHEAQQELKHFRRNYNKRSTSPDSMYESLASELEASDSGFSPSVYNNSGTRSVGDEILFRDSSPVAPRIPLADSKPMTRKPETIPEDPQSSAASTPTKSMPTTTTPMLVPRLELSPVLSLQHRSSVSSSEIAGAPSVSSLSTPVNSPPRNDADEKVTGGRRLSPNASTPSSGGAGGAPLSKTPSTDSLSGYDGPSVGEPGLPGTRDLEFAIRRLSVRRKVELDFQRYKREYKRALLTGTEVSSVVPTVSPATSDRVSLAHSTASTSKRLPSPGRFSRDDNARKRGGSSASKFLIYKPIEGSKTLKQWRSLADPNVVTSDLLLSDDDTTGARTAISAGKRDIIKRRGILTRTDIVSEKKSPSKTPTKQRPTDQATNSPKRDPPTSVTPSLVDSLVLHPETKSPTDEQNTPHTVNSALDDGTTTYSTSGGLAKALKERSQVSAAAGRSRPMTTTVWKSSPSHKVGLATVADLQSAADVVSRPTKTNLSTPSKPTTADIVSDSDSVD